MITLRNVRTDDLDALHQIHQATSSNPNKTPQQWQLAYLKYVDYYPRFAFETSFVACDENDKPLGYLLCESDADRFFKLMSEAYQEEMDAIVPGSFERFMNSQSFLQTFKDQYPAHLHIDLLPSAQNMHLGSKLMKQLIEELKARNIPGVLLGVSKTRPQAIHFYKKHGFEVLEEEHSGYTMGLKLDESAK
ncbi:GNAT family N-acetyltransferase [Erysipelotrichaceae bacterium 51-3]